MKIKVISWKMAIANAVFYIAIFILIILSCIVAYKLASIPPCTETVKGQCVIDGWSVAGLAIMVP